MKKNAFTLVEILIVVVILGILATIVIPKFSEASSEAKTSSLTKNLQNIRASIQYYKVQHNDSLPGSSSGVSFVEALLNPTNMAGEIVANSAIEAKGPYLNKIPQNPFNNLDTVELNGTLGNGSHGWNFNTTTGAFYADDSNEHSEL